MYFVFPDYYSNYFEWLQENKSKNYDISVIRSKIFVLITLAIYRTMSKWWSLQIFDFAEIVGRVWNSGKWRSFRNFPFFYFLYWSQADNFRAFRFSFLGSHWYKCSDTLLCWYPAFVIDNCSLTQFEDLVTLVIVRAGALKAFVTSKG